MALTDTERARQYDAALAIAATEAGFATLDHTGRSCLTARCVQVVAADNRADVARLRAGTPVLGGLR